MTLHARTVRRGDFTRCIRPRGRRRHRARRSGEMTLNRSLDRHVHDTILTPNMTQEMLPTFMAPLADWQTLEAQVARCLALDCE